MRAPDTGKGRRSEEHDQKQGREHNSAAPRDFHQSHCVTDSKDGENRYSQADFSRRP